MRTRAPDRQLVNMAWAATVALLAVGVLLAARNELAYRSQTARQVEVQADILAASVSAALVFEDQAAMREYVNALAINRAIGAAAVYDASGRRVAEHHEQGTPTPAAQLRPTPTHWLRNHLEVTRTVTQQGSRLGFVYLQTRPEPWSNLVARHGSLALLTLMGFLLMGVVSAAAGQLQMRARMLGEANARLREEMAARSKAEDALRQSQKMEALGQLTGGIAHDFNNLLQVVHGAFELIRRRSEDPERVKTWADNGLAATERGASLTRQLLAFSRSQKLELRPFVVAELVLRMRELLERTLGRDIALDLELDEDRVPVLSDSTQLELAVLNLAINARDAMPAGGRLTIRTRIVRIEGEDPELAAGDYVELSVTDTGEGMNAEVVGRAFDPFFTTKDVGKGTGLGLSQVYGVARQAGGIARIRSAKGEGTTVTLWLRRSTGEAAAAPERTPATGAVLAPAGGRTVLVVDDEPQVRALAAETLELLGYRVLTADGGPAALEILSRERPDVMLFDYAMPGMNGAELAKRARERWPDTPIVFASGHADSDAVEQALGGQAVILRKPFNMDALARTVAGLTAGA